MAKFSNLVVDTEYTYQDIAYRKIPRVTMCGYGVVNCIGPKTHDCDTGHRYTPDDADVEIVSLPKIRDETMGVSYPRSMPCVSTVPGLPWCAIQNRLDDDDNLFVTRCGATVYYGDEPVVREPTCTICRDQTSLVLGMEVVWAQSKKRGDAIEIDKMSGTIDEFIGQAAMIRVDDGRKKRKQVPCAKLTPKAEDTPLSIFKAAAQAVQA